VRVILFLLAYLGGMLTIISPCILPVLPFVFARAEQPFLRAGLPLLVGMAVTFAALATLAAVGGNWAINANQYGRYAALVVLSFFALTLLSRRLAEYITRPFVALGNRLTQSAGREESGPFSSLLLGVATGLLWSPCAGPILGLILTAAAIQGASASTTLLLLAYALGAATSLALALIIGGSVFAAMKKSLGVGEWVRRGLGVAVLAGVFAIALGLDTGVLARLSLAQTAGIEQALVDRAGHQRKTESYRIPGSILPVEGEMPELDGATGWINSPPISKADLSGKIVLFDFWTYSCINCIRALPYVRAWEEKYRDHGLVVIGIHTPEFAFERVRANVERATRELKVTYPVAMDNGYKIWKGFDNRYWPALFFVDQEGRIRHHHFGEGKYEESERVLQQLLREAGVKNFPTDLVTPNADGAGMASNLKQNRSPETYLGYGRAKNFASGEMLRDKASDYVLPETLAYNQWALSGQWRIGKEKSALVSETGRITFRFRARDVHLVLAAGADHKPVRFRVTLDGAAPGSDAGVDINAAGEGMVEAQRLYQLIRQADPDAERLFEIEFLDPGVEAFAFTFG